ncbi:MAG: PEP-CTERM sorting domain-containing protein [Phycisphaerae bacterium]|nr:PEP-CTERM sorting domain-containing protein [Phycisphaerae bacterium]
MMSRPICGGLAAVVMLLLVGQISRAAPATIQYTATALGDERWMYTYEVGCNNSLLSPIEQFTIWFDYGLYENLAVATIGPLAADWDELVIEPDPFWGDDGFYDALALADGIEFGAMAGGFAVSFDWLGAGAPGSQVFEIINPATYETRYTGITVPEPATFLPLGLALLLCTRSRRVKPALQL